MICWNFLETLGNKDAAVQQSQKSRLQCARYSESLIASLLWKPVETNVKALLLFRVIFSVCWGILQNICCLQIPVDASVWLTPPLVVSIYWQCCSIEMIHNYLICLDELVLPQFTVCTFIQILSVVVWKIQSETRMVKKVVPEVQILDYQAWCAYQDEDRTSKE